MFESEEPNSFIRDWFIPWYTNAAIWAITVTAFVLNKTIQNPNLMMGPLPKLESEAVLALADNKTVLWPLAAVTALGAVAWLLNRRPLKKRKGRKAPKYLLKQIVDEFRSFAINAASLSAITCYYSANSTLLASAIGCWLAWIILQWRWLQENGSSPLDP